MPIHCFITSHLKNFGCCLTVMMIKYGFTRISDYRLQMIQLIYLEISIDLEFYRFNRIMADLN